MFLKHGRLTWPLVAIIAFSTLILLLGDYAWRMVQAPITVIAGTAVAALLAGNILILVLGRRRGA